MKCRNASLWVLALSGILSSCIKDKDPEPAEPQNKKPDVISVLKDNSSWKMPVAFVKDRSKGVGYIDGNNQIIDFSIVDNQILHSLNSESTAGQQGSNNMESLVAYNLATNKPEKADSLYPLGEYNAPWDQKRGLFPYSGRVQCFSSMNQPNSYKDVRFSGSFKHDHLRDIVGWRSTGYWTGGWGYYNLFFEHSYRGYQDTVYALFDLAPPNRILTVAKIFTPAMDAAKRVAYFLEPRYSGSQGTSFLVNVRQDSVLVHNILPGLTAPSSYPVVAAMANHNNFPANGSFELSRHYSPSGDVMSMMIYESTTKRYWTYSYNSKTKILNAVLNNADLPYSGDGTDLDMDEEGNIYYTGYAGNGANTNGVSVYKRSPSGATLVGSDDFLKSGTANCLRYLYGKPYVGVVSNFAPRGDNTWVQWVEFAFVCPQ